MVETAHLSGNTLKANLAKPTGKKRDIGNVSITVS